MAQVCHCYRLTLKTYGGKCKGASTHLAGLARKCGRPASKTKYGLNPVDCVAGVVRYANMILGKISCQLD